MSEEDCEEPDSTEDVRARIEEVPFGDPDQSSRLWHELHEALRAGTRDRARVEIALDRDHRDDERLRNGVDRRRLQESGVDLGLVGIRRRDAEQRRESESGAGQRGCPELAGAW